MTSFGNFSIDTSSPRATPQSATQSFWEESSESRKEKEKLADGIAQETLKGLRPTHFVPIDPRSSPASLVSASPLSPSKSPFASSPSSIASTPSMPQQSPFSPSQSQSPSPFLPEASPSPAAVSPGLPGVPDAAPEPAAPIFVSQFPMEQFLNSLSEALHPLRVKEGVAILPFSAEDIEAIRLFYDHILPMIMDMTDEQGQPISRIPAGYVFYIGEKPHVLPRTVEIVDNLFGTGRTPYLALNRKAINPKESERKLSFEDVLDKPIDKGSFKNVKFCVDLNTGFLCARATMLENAIALNEISFIRLLNGKRGIMPTLGILHFTSKKLDKNKQLINKIAIITPYYRLGCLFDFLLSKKIEQLFPNRKAMKNQRLNLIRTGLEGLLSMHEGVSFSIGGTVDKVRHVHCDVKPENFMVSQEENGDLRMDLFDFGLSRRVCVIRDGHGSPAYLPVELLNSYFKKDGTFVFLPANDMWAFGITAYAINYTGLPYSLPNDKDPSYSSQMSSRYEDWQKRKHDVDDKESFLDQEPQHINRADFINTLAFACMRMNPTTRATAQKALDFARGVSY